MYNEELYHYGIKGMKWGVRRYRNYGGSYTQAGLKRFDNAMAVYNTRKSAYDGAKSSGIKGYELKAMKTKVKEAKADVKKHYAHLSIDKRADEGKLRYAKGERITDNERISNTLTKIGGLSLSAAAYAQQQGLGDEKTRNALIAIGATSLSAGAVKRTVDRRRNNQLRAYYAHTSKY